MPNHHDFVMACILQNTFSVFSELRKDEDTSEMCYWQFDGKDTVNPERTERFFNKCLAFTDEIFYYSLGVAMNVEL